MAGGTAVATYKNLGNGQSTLALACTLTGTDGVVYAIPTKDVNYSLAGKTLNQVVTKPDSGTAPTASYDLTLTDADTGIDVMGGSLADRSATAAESAIPMIGAAYSPVLLSSTLTLNVTNNSVANAIITVILYLSK